VALIVKSWNAATFRFVFPNRLSSSHLVAISQSVHPRPNVFRARSSLHCNHGYVVAHSCDGPTIWDSYPSFVSKLKFGSPRGCGTRSTIASRPELQDGLMFNEMNVCQLLALTIETANQSRMPEASTRKLRINLGWAWAGLVGSCLRSAVGADWSRLDPP
jgi:hypothetical protein